MISVIIPLFNENGSLRLFQERLHRVITNLLLESEVIYVDDGSTDSSLEVLEKLRKIYPYLKVISFQENYGQSAALFAGFKAAKGEWIITIDADLQNPPEEITKFLEFKDKFDFITGIRRKRKDSFLKILSANIAGFFRRVILQDTTKDTGCSLRMFRRQVIEAVPLFKNFHRFFTFLAKEAGFKIKEIPIEHDFRKFGKSKYGILRRAKEGIFDLIGVFWLKRRIVDYEIKYKC